MKTSAPLRFSLVMASVLALMAAVGCDKDSPNEPPDCTTTVSPTTFSVPANGGTGSTSISVAAECTWTVQSNASWLTVTTAASGSGPATVTFSAAANAGTAPRTGTLTVAGQTVTVTQPGTPPTTCTYTVAPESAVFSKDGGTATVNVTAADGCAWTATSNASWAVITSGSSGTGNGAVTVSAGENNDTTERSTTLLVAGKTVTLLQLGETAACDYSVAPVQLSTCMPNAVLTTVITTAPGCAWTAQPNASWMDVDTLSGSGPASIRISVSSNYDLPREGIVMVRWPTPTAGQNVRIAQAGCIYAVSPGAVSVPATQTSQSFWVHQESDPNTCGGATQDACIWSAVADVPWIVITSSMPRAGDQPVFFTVLANSSGGPRTGTIRVRDQVILVAQN